MIFVVSIFRRVGRKTIYTESSFTRLLINWINLCVFGVLFYLGDNEIWIMKPCGLNQGKGICLIRSKEEFYRIEEARDEDIRHNPRVCRARIVQKYAFLILSFAFELISFSLYFAEISIQASHKAIQFAIHTRLSLI